MTQEQKSEYIAGIKSLVSSTASKSAFYAPVDDVIISLEEAFEIKKATFKKMKGDDGPYFVPEQSALAGIKVPKGTDEDSIYRSIRKVKATKSYKAVNAGDLFVMFC